MSTEKKSLLYFHNLIVNHNYSLEFTSEIIQKLSKENPHIPPWVFSSSLGAGRGELSGKVAYSFDKGELEWIKDPNYRIWHAGSLHSTTFKDETDGNHIDPVLSHIYDELVEKNPHVPPWSIMNFDIKDSEDKLITAFNEGEIVWIKNPDKRNNLLTPKNSPRPAKMGWGTKLFFAMWILGLYYTVNISFENSQGWDYIIRCVWVILTCGLVYASIMHDK